MQETRAIYAASALQSLPRLLSLLDRNSFSPTYGCFHRDYWLYKTSDFPDAVRQFAVHALALAYAHDLPGNIYRGNPNVRDWAIAGLTYWAKIQHADGSFDEFYPFERGWVGPTAFTTYAAAEAYRLLRPELEKQTPGVCSVKLQTPGVCERVEQSIRRAAQCIAHGESEEDHLGNHHAMAVLAVTTAADVLNDQSLWAAVPALWRGFLNYQDPEGWAREYDGADPGYLSATISFLVKARVILRRASMPGPASSVSTDYRGFTSIVGEIREVLAKAVEFCSYFVYPDGSYAGTIGSRNTLHFYPHGFEVLAREMPIAASIADRMAHGLTDGKLVPPAIMSDRYVHYRVPEFLLAAIDTGPRPAVLSQLPYERPPFGQVFPNAGIAVSRHGPAYTVANLAKGGAIKSFNAATGRLMLNDTGWVGELGSGQLVTSQWIDSSYVRQLAGDGLSASREQGSRGVGDTMWTVSGRLNAVPSVKLFTLWTHLAFRLALALLGWYPPAAHRLKDSIRKSLILGHAALPCTFTRRVGLSESEISVIDELSNEGRLTFRRLLLGGEYPMRYVPQSRFFQTLELETRPRVVTDEEIRTVNSGRPLRIERRISL